MILVLKHKWFDMIASGVKREEYRDYNDRYLKLADKLNCLPPDERIIEFRRGYTKTTLKIRVNKIGEQRFYFSPLKRMTEGFKLLPSWGYERNRDLIIFQLGEIVKGGQG